jgi:hypothetical protein
MIIQEDHIELCIVHADALLKFKVRKKITDRGFIFFKIMYEDEHLYTLVKKDDRQVFSLELSPVNAAVKTRVDKELHSKIIVSLYAALLNEEAS